MIKYVIYVRLMVSCGILTLAGMLPAHAQSGGTSSEASDLVAYQNWAQSLLADFEKANQLLDTVTDKQSATRVVARLAALASHAKETKLKMPALPLDTKKNIDAAYVILRDFNGKTHAFTKRYGILVTDYNAKYTGWREELREIGSQFISLSQHAPFDGNELKNLAAGSAQVEEKARLQREASRQESTIPNKGATGMEGKGADKPAKCDSGCDDDFMF